MWRSLKKVTVAGLCTVGVIGLSAGNRHLSAQSKRGHQPGFAVVSIKPMPPGVRGHGLIFSPGGYRGVASLDRLVTLAYELYDSRRLRGAVGWMRSDHFQVETRTSHPTSRPEQDLMLRTVLTDRFGLKFRWESSTVPGFSLVVAKGGPKLKRASPGAPSGIYKSSDSAYGDKGGGIGDLVWWLGLLTGGKPVLDQTGLKGRYEIELHFVPSSDPSSNGPKERAVPVLGPTLFSALRNQLGLELEPTKVPMRDFVILSAHEPTPN